MRVGRNFVRSRSDIRCKSYTRQGKIYRSIRGERDRTAQKQEKAFCFQICTSAPLRCGVSRGFFQSLLRRGHRPFVRYSDLREKPQTLKAGPCHLSKLGSDAGLLIMDVMRLVPRLSVAIALAVALSATTLSAHLIPTPCNQRIRQERQPGSASKIALALATSAVDEAAELEPESRGLVLKLAGEAVDFVDCNKAIDYLLSAFEATARMDAGDPSNLRAKTQQTIIERLVRQSHSFYPGIGFRRPATGGDPSGGGFNSAPAEVGGGSGCRNRAIQFDMR